MGYSITIKLIPEAPIKAIVYALKEGCENKNYFISSVSKEHTYAPDYEHGVSLSFSQINKNDIHFIYQFLYRVAMTFGVKELNLRDGIEYPIYYYDREKTFILTDTQFKVMDRTEFSTIKENNIERLLSSEELEDIEVAVENNEIDATILDDITYYSFSQLKHKDTYTYTHMEKPTNLLMLPLWFINKTDDEKRFMKAFEKIEDLLPTLSRNLE